MLHFGAALLSQSGTGIGLALEILEGVLQPYFVWLLESIQIVPASETQQLAELCCAELLCAVSFQQQGFAGSARKGPPFAGELFPDVLRLFDGGPHQSPSRIT